MYDELFPQIVKCAGPQGRASYEEKCLVHEKLLYQYLIRKIDGWTATSFLDAAKIEKYALYAVTDFTTFFCKEIIQGKNKYNLKMICDRNAKDFPAGFMDYEVILPDRLATLYRKREIEKIIVMSVLHENEIIDDLLGIGILLNDIISFVSILYS